MPWPHRPAVPVTQLSDLESEGLYYELPHNATPGSPVVKDLGRAPQGLLGQSLRSPWVMAPDSHVYTVSISLTDTAPSLPQGRQQHLPEPSERPAGSTDIHLSGPPLQDQRQEQQQSSQSPTLSTEKSATDVKPFPHTAAPAEKSTAVAASPSQAPASSALRPDMASATSAGEVSGTPAGAASQPADAGPQPVSSAAATSASSRPASASVPVNSPDGKLVFKFGSELDYTAVEAARRAAMRVQQQCLIGSQEYLTPMAHSWVTKFQQFVLSQGLADSLMVVPGLTWFPGPHVDPLAVHVDYVLYDGAQTVFVCSLLFHSRFHWLQPNLRTHEKVAQLADNITAAAALAAWPDSAYGPGRVLQGMRVGAVGMMPALQGNTQTDYVKGVVEACREDGISLFSADSEVLYVAESRPTPWRRSSAVAASAMHKCSCERPGRLMAVRKPQHLKRSGASRRPGGFISRRTPKAPAAAAARPLKCGC